MHAMASNNGFPALHGSAPVHTTTGEGLVSPFRIVLGVACLLAMALMLAAIVGVAQAQVAKGQDFQFSRQLESASGSQFYANHGGSDTTEFVRGDMLQRVNYTR